MASSYSNYSHLSLDEIDEQIDIHRTLLENPNSDSDEGAEFNSLLSTVLELESERARRTNQRTMANYSSPYRLVAQSPFQSGSSSVNDSPLPLPQWGSQWGSSTLLPNTSRKRPGDPDLLDVPGPSKRPASRESRLSESPSSRRQSNDSEQDLLEFLGIDDPDELRMFQDEQKRAEEFLEQRREEERRNAEVARRIQEGLDPSPRPYSAQSSSTNYSGSNVFNGVASPSLAPGNNNTNTSWPNFSPSLNPLPIASFPDVPAPTPFNPRREPSRAHVPSVISLLDSDDSDVGEISPMGRRRRQPLNWPSELRSGMSPYQLGMAHARGVGSPIEPSGLGLGTRYGPNVLQSTMARLGATNQRMRHESDFLNPFDRLGPFPGLSSDLPLGDAPIPDSWRYDHYLRYLPI